MIRIRLPSKAQLCRNTSNDKGFATIWYLIGVVALVFMASFVLSAGYNNIQQNKMKSAMDHAVKAAVLQYKQEELSQNARIIFDPNQTKQAFERILQENLKLDSHNNPKKGSILSDAKDVEVLYIKIYDDTTDFPKTVEDGETKFKHTFKSPGVAAMLQVKLPDLWGTGIKTYDIPAVAEVNLEINGGKE